MLLKSELNSCCSICRCLEFKSINEYWLIVPLPPISTNMHCYTANCLAPLCLLTRSQDMKEEKSAGESTSCACKSLLMAHSRHHQAASASTITAHCCLRGGCSTLFYNSAREKHYNISEDWLSVFLSKETDSWRVGIRKPLKFRIHTRFHIQYVIDVSWGKLHYFYDDEQH